MYHTEQDNTSKSSSTYFFFWSVTFASMDSDNVSKSDRWYHQIKTFLFLVGSELMFLALFAGTVEFEHILYTANSTDSALYRKFQFDLGSN